MANVEHAMKVAQKIGDAIARKFPKHTLYVRRTETGNSGYIEIALRPEGGSYSNELTTAYSDDFFASATAETIQDKGRRVLQDFRVHFGQK